MDLPPPTGNVPPPPPTSLPGDLEAETRSNLLLIALVVLMVILILLTIPTAFDWVARPVSSELNGKLDLVTGALLTILVDVIRRASTFGSHRVNDRTKEPPQ